MNIVISDFNEIDRNIIVELQNREPRINFLTSDFVFQKLNIYQKKLFFRPFEKKLITVESFNEISMKEILNLLSQYQGKLTIEDASCIKIVKEQKGSLLSSCFRLTSIAKMECTKTISKFELKKYLYFTSRGQLISYAGYDVVEKQSGSSIKGKTKISKKGNSQIRRALYFPAISAVKHEPQLKKLFLRILDNSGIKMKGYVAVQRKLLLLIYTLFKNDTVYDPNYLNTLKETEDQAKEIEKQIIQNL